MIEDAVIYGKKNNYQKRRWFIYLFSTNKWIKNLDIMKMLKEKGNRKETKPDDGERCNQLVYTCISWLKRLRKRRKISKSSSYTIIDRKIKVVGLPDPPWICIEDLFIELKKEYSMKRDWQPYIVTVELLLIFHSFASSNYSSVF